MCRKSNMNMCTIVYRISAQSARRAHSDLPHIAWHCNRGLSADQPHPGTAFKSLKTLPVWRGPCQSVSVFSTISSSAAVAAGARLSTASHSPPGSTDIRTPSRWLTAAGNPDASRDPEETKPSPDVATAPCDVFVSPHSVSPWETIRVTSGDNNSSSGVTRDEPADRGSKKSYSSWFASALSPSLSAATRPRIDTFCFFVFNWTGPNIFQSTQGPTTACRSGLIRALYTRRGTIRCEGSRGGRRPTVAGMDGLYGSVGGRAGNCWP